LVYSTLTLKKCDYLYHADAVFSASGCATRPLYVRPDRLLRARAEYRDGRHRANVCTSKLGANHGSFTRWNSLLLTDSSSVTVDIVNTSTDPVTQVPVAYPPTGVVAIPYASRMSCSLRSFLFMWLSWLARIAITAAGFDHKTTV
jgi:hypothetical protein